MNAHSLGQLLHAERERYYRIAYSYVKNEQDALDIVGEAACRALEKLRTLRDAERFLPWMTRIVVNCAIDHLRRSSRLVYMDEALPEPAAPSPGPEAEDSLDLYAALDILPPRERSCVTLRYFEELSYAEIGRIMDEPEPTVRSRVHRALRKMRDYLQEGHNE